MKSLTNLEFNKGGNKFNSIVSRETLGETKQISEFYEENGTAKYIVGGEVKEIGNGDKQTLYTIKSTKWEPITNTGSYKFKVTLKLPFEVGELDIVMLANTNTLLFEKYGISAMNLGVDNVDIICRKQPTEDINVKLIFSKAKVLDAPIEPTSASLFTFDGTSCTGYVGDQNAPQIIIPRSYSIAQDGSFIDGNDYQVDSISAVNRKSGFETYIGKSIIILDNITKLNEYALSRIKISSIKIPNSVINIGFNALGGSFLVDVYIGSGVVQLNRSLLNNLSLENIEVSSNNKNYSSLDGILFTKDKTTLIQCPSNKQLGRYEIPNSVTKLEFASFDYCSKLETIIIPVSVVEIGDWSFEGCTLLNDIQYQGTIEQWNTIAKTNDWIDDTPAQVVHCTDGDAPIGGV